MLRTYRIAGMNKDPTPGTRIPLWFLVSSILLIAVAIILLVLLLENRLYASNLSAALVLVLVLLGCTAFLHVRAWYIGRRSTYATESEFASVYQHALDGILILDDKGVCLDANPAAFALLGAPPAMLLGHSFSQFYEDNQQFERQWHAFLECRYKRAQAELVRANRSKICVHYTIANYLPGRHVLILCDVTERVQAQDSLRRSNERMKQISDNIHEVVWMMETSTKQLLEVNRAYETITGRSLESIARDPSSYAELIHPSDRVRVLARLEEAVRSGHFDEEFRIVRPGGEVRWVSVKASPLPPEGDAIRQLVGTAQDITARKRAETEVARHIVEAETAREQADAARAEAEALRKATLALTQNLRMDAVLDTLLRCLHEIVPYDSARVILTEEGGRLFVAREAPPAPATKPLVTLELARNVLLERVLLMKKSVYVPDTREEREWQGTKVFGNIRCWIAVPLIVSDSVLGFLSMGSPNPGALTTDHFRRAKSLAVSAAVAIQNARLYEWAEIYAAERRQLLKQANSTQKCEVDSPPPSLDLRKSGPN
jgi:PAS domain S-box-containing protein